MKPSYGSVYFLGIGGIGMSALARYCHKTGMQVSGYDRTQTSLTLRLEREGINIHYEHNISKIPDNIDVAIYTSAINENNPEMEYLKQKNIPCIKRAKFLAEISNRNFSIAVAGTHGKTTISSIIAHILNTNSKDTLAFIGGIMNNYDSNLIMPENFVKNCVVEADEYDKSFLNINPDIAVISAIDADHLDIYESYENLVDTFKEFVNGIKDNGLLVVKSGLPKIINNSSVHVIEYSTNENTGYSASNITGNENGNIFDVLINGQTLIKSVFFPFPGNFNIENAIAAIAVTSILGIPEKVIIDALANYRGVKRRFEFIIKSETITYIDDYAHHPKEIDALLHGVKLMFPDKKILGVFQPHLFSRTKDFADGFAKSLETLDEIVITDIYPAREKPIEGINAEFLLNKIEKENKIYCKKEDLPELFANSNAEVFLTIGAGDIDKMIEPIKNKLLIKI